MEEQLLKSLLAVQKALKAPKGQYNSFGRYKYRSCEDILEAVKPLLAENGLLLTVTDEIVVSEAPGADPRWYVKATATATDGQASISCSAFAREDLEKKGMDGSQVTGAASSYARKYALNGLLLIDDSKDADTDQHARQNAAAPTNDGNPTSQTPKDASPTATGFMKPVRDLWKRYVELRGDSDLAMSELLQAVGSTDMRSLTPPQAAKAAYYMQNYISAHGGA